MRPTDLRCVCAPKGVSGPSACARIPYRRAVVSHQPNLRLRTFQSQVIRGWAIAEVAVPARPPVIAVSLYAVLNYAAQSVLRAASDLLPVFDSEFGERVIIAGDFNMHAASRDKGERSRTVQIWGCWRRLGCVICCGKPETERS